MKGLLKVIEIRNDFTPEITITDEPRTPTTGEILSLFTVTTGPSLGRKDTKEMAAAIEKLIPYAAMKDNLKSLDALLEISCLNNLVTAYNENRVSPRLRELLEVAPPNWQEIPENKGKSWNQVIFKMIQDGRADFSEFKDQKITDNWLLAFKITHRPFPYVDTDIKTLTEELKKRRTEIKRDFAKSIKFEVEQDPEVKKQVTALMDLIDARYKLHTAKNTPLYFSSLSYRSYSSPDFYLNPATGEITDLRPYSAEIKDLLSPESWGYLKEFTTTGRLALLKAMPQEPPPVGEKLFDDKTFIELRNSKVTNTLTTASVGITEVAEQLQIFNSTGNDDEKEPQYDIKTNVPVKSGGEVIIKVSETPKGRALSPGTEKLRTLFDALFTMSGNMNFFIPVNGYMELCKQKDVSPITRRRFKQKLRRELSTLKKTTFSAKLEGSKEAGEIGILRNWLPTADDTIMVELEPRYCEALKQRNGGIMQLSKAVFWLDEKNTHLLPMYKTLCRNRTDLNNIKKGGRRPHAISYLTLFEHDLSYPSVEKIRKTRKYKQDIIRPMLNAIEILNREGYIVSKYIDVDDNEYTREEMENQNFVDFINPQKFLLFYDLVDFKEDQAMVEAALVRKKEREEARAKAGKRKRQAKTEN